MLTKAHSILHSLNSQEPNPAADPRPNPVGANPRDYRQEQKCAQLSLFDSMIELRQHRLTLSDSMVQIAQALIFCGMPYRPTTAREVVRRTRAADGTTITVTFKAMFDDVALPFGSDRTLLHWIVDKAIKTGNPFVSWNHAVEFMKDMQMSTGGRAFADLRKRYERLACMAITVHRSSAVDERLIMPIIRTSRLPQSISQSNKADVPYRSNGLGVQLDELFFREILEHHVPMSAALLLITDKKPQMQDYMMFLAWRSFAADAAKRDTLIPWHKLREQIWQDDTNVHRIRSRFKSAIACLQAAWPELEADARSKGLWIAPPKNGRHLLLGNGPRRMTGSSSG